MAYSKPPSTKEMAASAILYCRAAEEARRAAREYRRARKSHPCFLGKRVNCLVDPKSASAKRPCEECVEVIAEWQALKGAEVAEKRAHAKLFRDWRSYEFAQVEAIR